MLNEYKICPICHCSSAYVVSIYSSTSQPTLVRKYVCHNCGYEFDEPIFLAQEKPAAEEIFDFSKYSADPNFDAFNRHMDIIIQESARKIAEQAKQQAIDFVKKNKEVPTMQVSYKGFTGELVKLERKSDMKMCYGYIYDISIHDSEKQVTHSFVGVKLEDVKFLGGVVAFGG